jgi:hypothetical protein
MKKHHPGLVRPLDWAVLALACLVTLSLANPVYTGTENALVTVKGEGAAWIFPLEAEETVSVPGPLGETVVEIRDGRVCIAASPCANRLCIAAGAIHGGGGWVACLPNRVMVSISDSSGADVDAAAW